MHSTSEKIVMSVLDIKIRLGAPCSHAVGTEFVDNIISNRVVVWRVGAVGAIRLELTLIHLFWPFHSMITFPVLCARSCFETHSYRNLAKVSDDGVALLIPIAERE